MREPAPGEPLDGPSIDVGTVVRDAIPLLAATDRPLVVVEDGRPVGIVDRGAVLAAIAGEEG